MFTDPLCPFCNRIGGEVIKLSDRLGFKLKILLLNVHGEKGRAKCIEAVCRNSVNPSFNFIEYNKPEWKNSDAGKEFICQRGSDLVDKIEKLSEKLGIDSVPFFFINDGSFVSGASIEEVELLFKNGE
jgi:protein-disulfide isomerase